MANFFEVTKMRVKNYEIKEKKTYLSLPPVPGTKLLKPL